MQYRVLPEAATLVSTNMENQSKEREVREKTGVKRDQWK
jgi:hypothetical protein